MLHLVCDLHASKRNVAVLATAYDWKGGGSLAGLLPPGSASVPDIMLAFM